jgi:hypothetical protein
MEKEKLSDQKKSMEIEKKKDLQAKENVENIEYIEEDDDDFEDFEEDGIKNKIIYIRRLE